jgi:tetratricopeptide (TPR) repeat protein
MNRRFPLFQLQRMSTGGTADACSLVALGKDARPISGRQGFLSDTKRCYQLLLRLVLVAVAFLSRAVSLVGPENPPLLDRALKLQSEGKLSDARNLLLEAASRYRAARDTVNLSHVQGIAADISVSLGLYKDAIAEATEALKFRVPGRDGAAIAEDYNIILADYPNALANYRHTLENDRARADAEGEVTTLNNIGNIYYFQGSYSEALREYENAISKTQAAGTHAWIAARRDLTLANLAVLYQRIGQETRALSYYRDLTGAHADMPAHERAQLLLNQGVLYRRLGDPVKALELYRAAQTLFAADRHRDGEIGALRNIGIA